MAGVMAFKVPPANTLRFFEAAARLKGFKYAAEEIHVTPSAVSHGINTLEDWLGVQLFTRNSHGLALTEAGECYLPDVRKALSILASATERLPGRRALGTISIGSSPLFATRWLIPRLQGFTAKYPNIRVTIDTDSHQNVGPSGVDLAVRQAAAANAQGTWLKLAPEECLPVCSPKLKLSLGTGDAVAQLRNANLIHVTTEAEDWETWFAATGIRAQSARKGISVDSVQLALEAATQGLGVALGRKPLIDADLRNGALVELAGPTVATGACYWLVSGGSRDRPETDLFRTWLTEEFGLVRDPAKTALFRAV
jgi:LysR family glycine cleavage system transcriptional activator